MEFSSDFREAAAHGYDSGTLFEDDVLTAADSLDNTLVGLPGGSSLGDDITNSMSLDGYLYCRKGRSSGHSTLLSRKRFVSLSFDNGGSLKVFKEFPAVGGVMTESHPSSSMLQTVYSKLHRGLSHAMAVRRMDGIDMYIPAEVAWVAKDVENDQSSFAIEIPSGPSTLAHLDGLISVDDEGDDVGGGEPMEVETQHDESEGVDNGLVRHQPYEASVISTLSEERELFVHDLRDEVRHAQQRGKPFRVYFRCSKGSREKALWLKAFSKLGRLSRDIRKKKTFFRAITAPLYGHHNKQRGRTRRESEIMLAREVRDLDLSDPHDAISVDQALTLTNDVERLIKGGGSRRLNRDREYRVLPSYAYPHRWMTRREMNEEMILGSDTFHDLRVSDCPQKEIGSLRVEVLQCINLPKLDRTSDTDAVVYLVCGSYAFATDVIPNRANPIWLRKSRRACDFPLFHGYARLYVGVFDDERRREKDDFAGRVVIDLARLRPNSTYDVTLPLRLSTHVYSRRKRGAIRLRFTLTWKSERDALLSYIPRKLRIPLPQNSKPNYSVTVNCSDQKAFRNIAITVHGAHLPGRFTFHQMRASIRELNFTRRYVISSIVQGFRDTRHWKHPAISAFIFFAWMHSIYANAFSLVPAYAVMCFVLYLMRNYVKYGIELPQHSGFIPPSWEEMLMALARGGDPDYQAIETLELGHRPAAQSRRNETLATSNGVIGQRDYKALTHKPQGMLFFRALGFTRDPDAEETEDRLEHLEFPFADAVDSADYPKFGVRECLVERKGDSGNRTNGGIQLVEDGGSQHEEDNENYYTEFRRMPRFPHQMPQFPIDMNIHDVLRKDMSGLEEYDEEENNFTASRAVVASGRNAAKKVKKKGMIAATTLTEAATKTGMKVSSKISTAANELTEMTGLNHVVTPIRSGITHSSAMVSSGMNQMMAPITFQPKPGPVRRSHTADEAGHHLARPATVKRAHSADDSSSPRPRFKRAYSGDESSIGLLSVPSRSSSNPAGNDSVDFNATDSGSGNTPREGRDPTSAPWPEQNIDVEGPSTGKKLTEDLDDIKDKMHELLWHQFDDHAYVVKNPNAVYFGEGKRPEKRRKDVKKQLNKLLHVGQYSHSNPFVARVGLYVEPIIGSVYAFLCLFRAGFNVFTWQDPMLTFWLSFLSGILAFILFFFPWRPFLFVFGFWLVGPQNLVIRILRERGHLPPLKKPAPVDRSPFEEKTGEELLKGQPLFRSSKRELGSELTEVDRKEANSNEVHSVVVPYGPLMYQRFYDWPPEPNYAQVKPAALDEARRRRALSSLMRGARRPSLLSGATLPFSGGSSIEGNPSFGRGLPPGRTAIPQSFARRRRTGIHSQNGLPPLNPRRRANTGDWPGRSNHVKTT